MSTKSSNMDTAVDQLKKLYSKANMQSDLFASKDKVLSEFQEKFSHDKLLNLPLEEFYNFLHFKSNHHWTMLDMQIKNLKTNEDELRRALLALTDSSLDIADRIDSMPDVRGFDNGIYSPFLLVSSGLQYGVWNTKSKEFFENHHLLPQMKKSPQGPYYSEFNRVLRELSKRVGVDLWVLDALFHYALFEYTIPEEFNRRKLLWDGLKIGNDNSVLYNELKSSKIVVTQRELFASRIKGLDEYVAQTLLSTNVIYDSTAEGDYVLYDFPDTNNKEMDSKEANGIRASKNYNMPLFVVFENIADQGKRYIMTGIVTGINEASKTFLVKLSNHFPDSIPQTKINPTRKKLERFYLYEKKGNVPTTKAKTRPNQGKFHFDVISLYGLECAVCGIKHKPLIEAAHILPKANHGSDHPENGIPLCANHHKLFDDYWFTIDTDKNIIPADGLTLDDLQISYDNIKKLRHAPHVEALEKRYQLFQKYKKNM